MLSLDLFNSKFEKSLLEGTNNTVSEVEMNPPREPEQPVPDPRVAPDQATRTQATVIFQQLVKAFKIQQPIITLEWPGKPAVTLTRNQMYSVLKQIVNKPANVQNRWIPILGNRDEFANKLSVMKIEKAPKIRMPTEPGQQKLDLDEEKKSSQDSKFKSTRLDRLKTQARVKYPAAGSDMEALAADFVDQQDQDQREFERVKGVNQRQDELLRQITALNKAQDQEINDLEGQEQRLQQNIDQLRTANADLAKKLSAMTARRSDVKKDQAPAPSAVSAVSTTGVAAPMGPGVSVATDKQAEPAYTPLDLGARQRAAELQKQLDDLRNQAEMWNRLRDQGQAVKPEDLDQIRQDIVATRLELEKLAKQKAVMKMPGAVKKIKEPTAKKSKEPARPRADQMRGEIEPVGAFGVDQEFADLFGRLRQGATMQEVHDIASGQMGAMIEDEAKSIPRKMVIQGYTVEYDPVRRVVTVGRGGRVVGRAVNKPGSYNNYQVVANRIIDASEEDKYPDDLEARSVERPFGESTEELTAQDILFRTAAKAMYDANQQGVDIDYEEAIRIASRLMRIPYAPSMLPALQQQLQDVEKKIATLKSVKRAKRQREKEKLTHQTTADEERRAAEWMKNYGSALQRRLQTRQTESEEKKHSPAWEQGAREGYYGRAKNNPYDKGTNEHADWNRGYDHFKDDGKDYLRELDLDRSGQPMYQAEPVYMLTHNGKEIAFYKLKDLKRAEQDAREMQKKLGGEVHLRKVMREAEQPSKDDDIMGKLFRDFGEIFGKQPPQPKPQQPEKKDVKEGDVVKVDFRQGADAEAVRAFKEKRAAYFDKIAKADHETAKRLRAELQDLEAAARRRGLIREGRAGYGPLLNAKHWHEVEQHLFKIINDPNVDDQTRAEAKQRWLDKQREAKLKGFKE